MERVISFHSLWARLMPCTGGCRIESQHARTRRCMRRRPFFIDSALGIVCLMALAIFSGAAFYLACKVQLDYFDGYKYLIQSLRLYATEYSFVPYEFARPRAGVIWVSLPLLFYRFLFDEIPPLGFLKSFMVLTSIGYVLVWVTFLVRLWNRRVAYLAGIFLMSQPLWIHYAAMLMQDVTAGLVWGIYFHFFLFLLERKKITNAHAIGLGVAGALVGLSKHHFALFLPTSLLLWAFWKRLFEEQWPEGRIIYRAIASWILAIEFVTRFFGQSGEGVWEFLRKILKESIRQKSEATSFLLYINATLDFLGPLFLVIAGVSLLTLWQQRKRIFDTSASGQMAWILLATVILYAALTQYISHREIRYGIPLLPGLLGFIAWGILERPFVNPRFRIIWLGLVTLSLLHPIYRSAQDFQTYLTDALYVRVGPQTPDFWQYLANKDGGRCDRILACRFFFKAGTSEVPDDPYYRQYDVEPQYEYYTKKKIWPHHCRVMSSRRLLLPYLLETFEPIAGLKDTDCFVGLLTRQIPAPRVVVFRPAVASEPDAECVGTRCFRSREFFFDE